MHGDSLTHAVKPATTRADTPVSLLNQPLRYDVFRDHSMYEKRLPLTRITVGQAVRDIAAHTRAIHHFRSGNGGGLEIGMYHIRADRRALLDELQAMGYCPDLGCTHCYPTPCLACGGTTNG